MQITFLLTAVGNSIQQTVFEIVSVSTHLATLYIIPIILISSLVTILIDIFRGRLQVWIYLSVGEMESEESVGFPHLHIYGSIHFCFGFQMFGPDLNSFYPLATASSPSQAVPASECPGRHTGLIFSGESSLIFKFFQGHSF